MTTTDQLDRLIEEQEASARLAVEHAVARGGLPDLEDLAKVREGLRWIFNVLEDYKMTVDAVQEAYEAGIPLPFEVLPEHIATIALVAAAVDHETDEFLGMVDGMMDKLEELDYARAKQAAAASVPAAGEE